MDAEGEWEGKVRDGGKYNESLDEPLPSSLLAPISRLLCTF